MVSNNTYKISILFDSYHIYSSTAKTSGWTFRIALFIYLFIFVQKQTKY